MSQHDDVGGPQRKRRTREHVIEDLSENHLERKVLLKGHLLRRPERDYGVDVTMFHFGSDGAIENGEVRFQLKATDNLKLVGGGTEISFPIKTGDLHYWALEIYPFFLVVFDASTDEAFWLHIQDYVIRHKDRIDREKKTVNVRIPLENKLSTDSIDFFRGKSIETMDYLRNQGGFPDVKRRPR